jgi:hypothetical protein
MQETIATDTKINEGSLYAGLQIDNFSTVNIAGKCLNTLPFHVQLIQPIVLKNGNPAFFRLQHVD